MQSTYAYELCPECDGDVFENPMRKSCEDCMWDEMKPDMRKLTVETLAPHAIEWHELQQVASIVSTMDGSWDKDRMWKGLHQSDECEVYDALVEVGVIEGDENE